TGLLEVATEIYGAGRVVARVVRSSFYGLRALVLTVVFSCLTGEVRAEGLTRVDPVAIGRLLGLDRAPEVKRLRFRIAELAFERRADQLQMGLAARHIAVHPEACGLLYVDGHVRAYHGKAEVQKAHVARMRIAMPGEIDTFVTDRLGQALLFWQAEPGQSLAGELRLVTEKVRGLLGPGARPTICFDRGGWSPKLFAELHLAGFDILTYKKGPSGPEPREAFAERHFVDDIGHDHAYLLSDHQVSLPYDSGRHTFSCRQITRLDEQSGHQTQVITTRTEPDAALLAYAMFSRWREENFFRYTRAHYGLDALDAYGTLPDDPARLVANPARRDAARSVAEARREIAVAQAREGQGALAGLGVDPEVAAAFSEAEAELARREEEKRSLPAKVPLGEARPDAVRLDVERKRIMDAIRMATYNAESGLARLLAPHYARAEDEARSLLREIFSSPGDLEVEGQTLHVRIEPLSAPRRTRALIALCKELTVTKTLYPGTDLTLVYSVKER
ncbi:MAG: putative transposase, partial [Acidimicrobiales bacterium]